MQYNTQAKRLRLPEYGRSIQNMVDYCKALPDREERQKCAAGIINIMGNMFPHLRDVNDFKHILWDHLAIMADFELDIDYPYEIISEESLKARPDKIPYDFTRATYKHYGKYVDEMLRVAATMEEGEERDTLVYMIANHMKKLFITWNKDNVDDRKIFDDLAELSKGAIRLTEEDIKLREARDLVGNINNNNNKKRQQNNTNRKQK